MFWILSLEDREFSLKTQGSLWDPDNWIAVQVTRPRHEVNATRLIWNIEQYFMFWGSMCEHISMSFQFQTVNLALLFPCCLD